MNKKIIEVPKNVRYISDWEEFNLPDFPSIIDKQITGCGFTEWIIKNKFNSILVSPRIILLENKEEQHPGEVFYAKNDLDTTLNVDKDLHTIKKSEKEIKKLIEESGIDVKNKVAVLRHQIRNYIDKCLSLNKPIKILVTYDSYRIVYEAIMESEYPEIFDSFYTVVDEFQSIFTDSKFKSNTELEFLSVLQGVQKLCFVSATPMMDTYLELLPEFKDLPYFELDWGKQDPTRIIKPQLSIHPCQKIIDTALKFIQPYLDGNFEKAVIQNEIGEIREIESRELVIYVNSVKNICDIIRKAGLKYENTNVLCSGSFDNNKKIRKAFGLGKGEVGGIGKVPLKHEPRKMFTLCTRTVYLGADFYSDNARTLILSDANIDCLAVDITLDLPQILGRQRLECNPWKNRAELYVRFLCKNNKKTQEQFSKYLNDKIESTNKLLSIYEKGDEDEKHNLALRYEKMAKTFNYKDDFVAVNTHGGSDLLPIFNRLVMISEQRAFDIQQLDYVDRFNVFNQISNGGYDIDPFCKEVNLFLSIFNASSYFTDKMKLLCESGYSIDFMKKYIFNQIPVDYSKYLILLGPEKIKAKCYKRSELEKYCQLLKESQKGSNKDSLILENFKIGDRLSLYDIKELLRNLYDSNEIKSSPKATDLLSVFEVKKVKIPVDGKRVEGYELLKLKDNE